MICAWVRQHGAAYLSGQMNPRARRRMSSHIASCPACSEALGAEERLEALLSRELGTMAGMPAPGPSWKEIRSSLAADSYIGEAMGWWREALIPGVARRFAVLRYWGVRAAVPAAGMAVAIIVAAIFSSGGEGGSPLQVTPVSRPVVIKIAFRPEGIPAPDGYCTSSGEAYGTRRTSSGSISYGWR